MKNFLKQFGRLRSASRPVVLEKPSFRWIVDGRLAVGPIPNSISLQQLQAAGFKSILTLCAAEERELPPEVPQQFHWQRMVLPDHRHAEKMQPEQLATAVAFVDGAMRQNQVPVYVHCLAGMERSPSVCVAYLCLHQGMEVWEALNWVKQRNSRTNLSNDQVQAIQGLVKLQQLECG